VVGDMGLSRKEIENSSKVQNNKEGPDPDGRAGIPRVSQEGSEVCDKGILGDEYLLNMYYAYGIRNSFGMDFDPTTGNLRDTEKGGLYDECDPKYPNCVRYDSSIYGTLFKIYHIY
jgi:aldose sugar dehydrogenase